MTLCWDCGAQPGVIPTVYKDGIVYRICRECHLDWRPFLHGPDCNCEHHAWCDSVLALEKLTGDEIPYGSEINDLQDT